MPEIDEEEQEIQSRRLVEQLARMPEAGESADDEEIRNRWNRMIRRARKICGQESSGLYNVHVMAVVRCKFAEIEAGSQTEAITRVMDTDFNGLFNNDYVRDHDPQLECVAYNEWNTGYLVEEAGDEDGEESTWYLEDGVTPDRGMMSEHSVIVHRLLQAIAKLGLDENPGGTKDDTIYSQSPAAQRSVWAMKELAGMAKSLVQGGEPVSINMIDLVLQEAAKN